MNNQINNNTNPTSNTTSSNNVNTVPVFKPILPSSNINNTVNTNNPNNITNINNPNNIAPPNNISNSNQILPNNIEQNNNISQSINKVGELSSNQSNTNITPISNSISNTTNNVNNIPNQQLNNQTNATNTLQNNIPVNTNISINNPNNITPPNNISNSNQIPPSNVNQPNTNNLPPTNDDELLKAFIGKNYKKITTRPFNFAGFFFTNIYLFYRKMFLYGLILFIINLIVLNVVNNYAVEIILNIFVGLFVNKLYLKYAHNKINKIKSNNQGKSIEELKSICIATGGTSVGKVFLGFFMEFIITIILAIIMAMMGIASIFSNMLDLTGLNIISTGSGNNNSNDVGTLISDVTVSGYSCIDSKCSVSIDTQNNTDNYVFNASNIELFSSLSNYKDYIKVNIYYTKNGKERSLNKYEIFLKSTNEDISNIKTEDELRSKIGLYSLGTNTSMFTLKEIGTTGFGFDDSTSYTYVNYTFIDEKNNEYEMKYIMSEGAESLNLVEGNKYTVTFEVVKGTFDYEFNIKSIK